MMNKSSIPPDAFLSICNNYNSICIKEDIIQEYDQFIKSKIDMSSLGILPEYLHQIQFSEESNSE